MTNVDVDVVENTISVHKSGLCVFSRRRVSTGRLCTPSALICVFQKSRRFLSNLSVSHPFCLEFGPGGDM